MESTKRKRRKRFAPYDYETAYKNHLEKLDEYFVNQMMKEKVKCIYATKEIRSGEQLEVEIFPEFRVLPQILQSIPKKSNNREAMRNLNDRNARKKCIRKLNANFTNDDIWMTLTYALGNEPQDIDAAIKDMTRYIDRINYRRRKLGLPIAKWLYVTEWCEKPGEEVRCHHHVVMDGLMDMDTCEKTWKKGERNQSRKLNKDDCGLAGMGTYITKETKGQKRWHCSLGLKDPYITKNHYKFKRKKVEQMVKDRDSIKTIMEKTYKDYKGCEYKYTDCEVKYNDFNNLFYIYVRMRRD